MTTNAGKLSAALPVIDQVVADFIASGIGEEELASEKASAINALSLSLDDPLPIANRLMRYELAGLGEPHNAGFQIDTYAARVNALTKAEVDAAIRTHYSLDGAVTVVAGTLPA
jgi:predicted Zn-dependent peptidase